MCFIFLRFVVSRYWTLVQYNLASLFPLDATVATAASLPRTAEQFALPRDEYSCRARLVRSDCFERTARCDE